ncbi:hypothetical protein ANCDUO_09078 [Ancylostoma duodenale]|uniref:Uncharacterized protein n=1 Tax=Ancylostoma duodenale TaxID=51022 RepID=A0A0C2CUT0_9BILA|nr:hypothetical protein ANCDUO_09078 [Ancylostoma duodenale]
MHAGDTFRGLIIYGPTDGPIPTRNLTNAPSVLMPRCLSDGDHALLQCSSRPSEPSTPKRIRHTTDISPVREQPEHRDRTLTEQATSRDRHITETSQEGIPSSLTEVEDDVIVDVCELEEEDEEDDDDEVDDEADFIE